MDPLFVGSKVEKITWKRSEVNVDIDSSNVNSHDVENRLLGEPLQLDMSSRYDNLNGSQTGDASMNHQKDLQEGQIHDPLDSSIYPKVRAADKAHMLRVLPFVQTQKCGSNATVILNETAYRKGAGPPVGAIDIGVGNSAYYFRVALPGVRKDPGDFSCEVERDGMVHIHGVTTTGEKMVSRYGRVYNMTLQQQCAPGPFTLSFCLPGPVDPSLFSPNFRSDGIFEGVVVKYKCT